MHDYQSSIASRSHKWLNAAGNIVQRTEVSEDQRLVAMKFPAPIHSSAQFLTRLEMCHPLFRHGDFHPGLGV